MTLHLSILQHGRCEPFKAGVHGAALSLAIVMGLYNAAAWLGRRERHLWINVVVYCLLTEFERRHMMHHVASCRPVALMLMPAVSQNSQDDATHAA